MTGKLIVNGDVAIAAIITFEVPLVYPDNIPENKKYDGKAKTYALDMTDSGNWGPWITAVTVPADGTYAAGETLELTLDYSDTVVVTGTPVIKLEVGGEAKQASYVNGSGTGSLTFAYTIQSGDSDSDGIEVNPQIDLEGGTIKNVAGKSADLIFELPETSGINIGNPPIPVYCIISGTIKGSDTNAGIYDAAVDLKDYDGNIIASTRTNANGQYSFSQITADTYSIDVRANGYRGGFIREFSVGTANISGKDLTLIKTGGSSSGGSGGSGPIVNPPASPVTNVPAQGSVNIPGTVDEGGNITANITNQAVSEAISKALAQAKQNGTEQKGINLVLNVISTGNQTANNLAIDLPKEVQDTLIAGGVGNITFIVSTSNGSIINIGMDMAALEEMSNQAKGSVNLTATRLDNSTLTAGARAAIGNRPVFDLRASYGEGAQVESFGSGSILITIPYTLAANEKAGNIQAVYVDLKGQVQWINSSVYDSLKGILSFNTNHFSTYGIGYKQDVPSFTDTSGHWAKEDIGFVASYGLLKGTSDTTFSPDTDMTRGMFITALGRLANTDVSGYEKSSFTDVKNDAYYMGYIQWASKNSIANGVGNGRFAPDQSITREQMAVIMQNYAKAIGITLPKIHEENTFADSIKISAYAKDAVKEMQTAGIINGKNGNLFDPQGRATRAEVSAVLHRFVERMNNEK